MLEIAASRWEPIAKAEGSLKVAPLGAPAPAGEGVAGGSMDVVEVDAAAGAGGGAAGVAGCVVLAGVDGTLAAAAVVEVTGAGLGY